MVVYLPSPEFLPPMFNGARSLVQGGFLVDAICVGTDPLVPRQEQPMTGYTTINLFSRTQKFFTDHFGLSPGNIITAAVQYATTYIEFNAKAVMAAFRSNPDLYEAHDLPALLPTSIAAFLRRKPLAYHAHELYAEMHEKVRFAGVWKFIEKTLVPFAAVVVTPEENRSRILFDECGAKKMPITVRNCPPYTGPLHSTKLRDVLAARGHTPGTIVLYQGLFDDSRCLRELIAASEFFDDGVLLVLVGGGYNEWKDPEQFIGRSKKTVVLPRVTYTELSLYTASADIGVLFYRNNCRNNYYCAPNKVHEYMMMGLPVVTNDYPGIAAFVNSTKIGLSVDSGNPKAIAEAVNTIAANPALHDDMKRNGLELSKNTYNWETEFNTLLLAYQNILNVDSRTAV